MSEINNKKLFNIVGFYLCWWVAILGAANSYFFIGPLFVMFFLFFHFFYVINQKKEIIFILICFFIGLFIDTFFLRFGVIDYKGLLPEKFNLAPLWVISLWMCFGSSISHSFKWVKGNYIFLFFLGAISGPLIYASATKLEVLYFNYSIYINLIIVSIAWGLFLPLVVYISDKLVD